tara:strand:- start:525 stop:701 length:177 start_codon:yes stop_codon:yes gene_type:complete
MEKEIETALKNCLQLIRANSKPEEALQFSQAALNLMQVQQLNSALLSQSEASKQKPGK